MTIEAVAPSVRPAGAPEYPRVEQLFARSYAVVWRQGWTYLALTLLLGVVPTLLIAAMAGISPTDVGHASTAVRLASMSLFVVGDALLGAALARLTLEDLAGRRPSLGRALRLPRGKAMTFLLIAIVLDVPMLALNLVSGLVTSDPRIGFVLYLLRFAVGVSLGALLCGAAAAALVEGLGAKAALLRAAALTRGHRLRIGLFFAAFFVLKVLGPYLLFDWWLRLLLQAAPVGQAEAAGLAVAVATTVLWNLLACALGVSTTLIYAELRRIKEGANL